MNDIISFVNEKLCETVTLANKKKKRRKLGKSAVAKIRRV